MVSKRNKGRYRGPWFENHWSQFYCKANGKRIEYKYYAYIPALIALRKEEKQERP